MKFHDLRSLISPSGARRVTVDLAFGGHVVSFALGERQALATGTAEIGSTLWPSPQNLWGWPPPVTLDKAQYGELPAAAGQLAISSQICSITHLQLQKCFWFDGERLQLRYILINRAATPQRVAPWEVTRVPGGLSFYPSARVPRQFSVPESAEQDPRIHQAQELIWHRYDPEHQAGHYKLFGEGGPWLANFNGGLLMVKHFPPLASGQLAPGQAAVEIYAHSDTAAPYIELEQQGPWLELPPGGESHWQVSWDLMELPPTLTPAELGAAAAAMS